MLSAVNSNGSPFGTLLLLGAVGLLVMLFLRTRRAQREAATNQSKVAPGAEIMTTSGLYATVVSVEDGVMTLDLGAGHVSRWDQRAVAKILSPGTTRTVQSGDGAAENSSDEDDAAPGDDQPPPGRE